MRKPIAYLRRSSASNSNGAGRVSFDTQRAAVLDLARRHGDDAPELLVEWGASGAAAGGAFGGTGRGGRRRAYHDLREAIAAGRVSAVYAYSLSRLARSTRELLDIAEQCVEQGVPIRLAKEGDIDGTSPHGRLYLTVLAAVATFEAEVAAERGKDRTASMRDRGAHIGRPPFGKMIGPGGVLVPDPAAAPIVDRVVELFRELRSPAAVAKALNDAGIPAPRPVGAPLQRGATASGKWGDATVRRILSRQPGGSLLPPTVRGSRAAPTAIFQRLVRCWCGQTLTPERSTKTLASGRPETYIVYLCSRSRFDRQHGPARITERRLLEFARAEAALLRTPEAVAQEADDSPRVDLEARRERIVDSYVAGAIDRADRDRRLAEVDERIAAIGRLADVVDVVPVLDWTWPAPQLNEVLRALWARIDVDRDMRPIRAEWLVPEWRAEA